MKKLSIITVCLNNKVGLKKTIQSVISQFFRDYEFIVVDGGSSDGSVELIKHYGNNINKWVSERDSGIYNAMNKGIKMSEGEYCLFLNSGDYLSSPTILQKVFEENHSVDIIYGNLIRKKGKKNYRIHKYPNKLTPIHFVATVPSIHHQASFIKKELFSKYGMYQEDLKIIADWEFFFRAVVIHHCSTQHLDHYITVFDSFGVSSGGKNSEELKKWEILQKHIPEEALNEYRKRTENKLNWIAKSKTSLAGIPIIYSIARMFYWPYRRLLSYIYYLKTSIKP